MKRLILLSLSILLAACGPNGAGGVTPPPPGVELGADGWPVISGLSLIQDTLLVEGVTSATLRLNRAAPTGYEWRGPSIHMTNLGGALFLQSRPNTTDVIYNVEGARKGVNTYKLTGEVTLRRLSDGQEKTVFFPLELRVEGSVEYPMYTQAQRGPTEAEREVLRLINVERVKGTGCGPNAEYTPAGPPMAWNDGLAAAARQQAYDMVTRGYFSHTSPEGFRSPDLTSLFGVATFGGGGDNIGTGYQTPQQVVQAWLNSPGHCVAMLNPARRFAGVGMFKPNDLTGEKWVLDVIDAIY